MRIIEKKKNFRVSNDIFLKIIRDLKSELKENKKEIDSLNQIDYKYNKKVVYTDKLIEIIDTYFDVEIVEKETKNHIIMYYGDPCVTIQVLLDALQNCQIVNLVIEDVCLGVNKLIFELYKDILKDYKIFDIVSFNNYENKKSLELSQKFVDEIYCLGSKNLYTVCKNVPNIKYIPFNNIDIYCEDENYYELANKIFETCYENGIEAEVYDDMPFEEAVDFFNCYSENYCSVILTKNDEFAKKFKENVKSKFVFVNENPINDEIFRIPQIF